MIQLIRVPSVGLKPAIKAAFKDDLLMLNQYHIKGGMLEDCVNDTFDKIREAQDLFPIEAYVINLNGNCIGFTVLSKQNKILYSFGISKYYRVKTVLHQWFDTVVFTLKVFVCYLWNKNTRAIGFLVKMGVKITDKNDGFTTLKYAGTS